MEEKTIFELHPDLDSHVNRAMVHLVRNLNLQTKLINPLVIEIFKITGFIDNEGLPSCRFLKTYMHLCNKAGIKFFTYSESEERITQVLGPMIGRLKEDYQAHLTRRGVYLMQLLSH